jgi:DNA-binding protein H-NS
MSGWEYRKIALNQLSAKTNDVDVLNDVGDEGWELVAILPNNIAFLKREIAPFADEGAEEASGSARSGKGEINGTVAAEGPRILSDVPEREETRAEVKAKYRDPKTGETWSGRGRMATWLKRKQDAGEDIDAYLV